jgi:hypothetical protein
MAHLDRHSREAAPHGYISVDSRSPKPWARPSSSSSSGARRHPVELTWHRCMCAPVMAATWINSPTPSTQEPGSLAWPWRTWV